MDLKLIVFFARFLLQCCLKQLTAQLQMNVRKIKLRSPQVIAKAQKHNNIIEDASIHFLKNSERYIKALA